MRTMFAAEGFLVIYTSDKLVCIAVMLSGGILLNFSSPLMVVPHPHVPLFGSLKFLNTLKTFRTGSVYVSFVHLVDMIEGGERWQATATTQSLTQTHNCTRAHVVFIRCLRILPIRR